MEGESLFNDGTAIVAFGIALEIAQHQQVTVTSVVLDFLLVAGGGILFGLLLGWLVSKVINQLDDYLIETALTFVLAYGAYFLAENFHVSGVLAVVTAGLINGNIGPRSDVSHHQDRSCEFLGICSVYCQFSCFPFNWSGG